jgi:hypothetical protein
MTAPVASGEDTIMNMTPMIDICFQLIVFFMLTLRFPSVSSRFETQLPKDRGQASSPAVLTPLQEITVKLFRKDTDQPDKSKHFTRIRVGESLTVELPKGPWQSDSKYEEERRLAEDKIFAQITDAIGAAWAQQNKNPEVKGEIKTPPPTGQLVPHGDVMRTLDAFIAAGLTTVNFEGAPPPLLSKEGGGWDFK